MVMMMGMGMVVTVMVMVMYITEPYFVWEQQHAQRWLVPSTITTISAFSLAAVKLAAVYEVFLRVDLLEAPDY